MSKIFQKIFNISLPLQNQRVSIRLLELAKPGKPTKYLSYYEGEIT
jgi:hypothetical protein